MIKLTLSDGFKATLSGKPVRVMAVKEDSALVMHASGRLSWLDPEEFDRELRLDVDAVNRFDGLLSIFELAVKATLAPSAIVGVAMPSKKARKARKARRTKS